MSNRLEMNTLHEGLKIDGWSQSAIDWFTEHYFTVLCSVMHLPLSEAISAINAWIAYKLPDFEAGI